MKKIKDFNCGPCLANTKIELYVFDNSDLSSLKKVAKLRNKPVSKLGAGLTLFEPWINSAAKEPIRILINTNRKDQLKAVFISLPHEMDHVSGFLSKKFCIDSDSEPIAYMVGYLSECFQRALLKEIGFDIVKKEDLK